MKSQEQLTPNAIGNSVNLGGKYPDDIITPSHYKKYWTPWVESMYHLLLFLC